MDIATYLQLMTEKHASDLYLSSGAPIMIKIEGKTGPVTQHALPAGKVKELAYSVMNDQQRAAFERDLELDMAISMEQFGRFRLNVFWQRGDVAMVIRYLKTDIPDIESLHLPLLLKNLIMEPRGLVLVVGATGSGKSTTLAAMIEHRNRHQTGHILTIEDPIEYLHHHHRSLVNQREVGVDTHSYADALKRAMREAPDVIMIGEIRDQNTMKHALTYAETGHLCLSTLHAGNVNQTMRRIVNFFPESAHRELFTDLAMHLKAVVAQRLVKGKDGKRIPAVEVMLASPYIRELIHKGQLDDIPGIMEKSPDQGMKTFDDALIELYHTGHITLEEALAHADSRNNVSVRIRLEKGGEGPDIEGMRLDDD
ncbi:PilT/PilU family type 4a pilus ATPase [Marinobacteraceae bacterium S3BR75-40.1]